MVGQLAIGSEEFGLMMSAVAEGIERNCPVVLVGITFFPAISMRSGRQGTDSLRWQADTKFIRICVACGSQKFGHDFVANIDLP